VPKDVITFRQLGDKWYVFRDRKNVLMGFETEAAARTAAAQHFDKKRKKHI